MVYAKSKKISAVYNFYEREKLYKKSSYLSLFILVFIISAFVLLHIIFNLSKIINVPKAENNNTYNEEVSKVYKNENIKTGRKILADYSDFIIYSAAPVIKKEEVKKEEKKVEKKQVKKIIKKKQAEKAKPKQKQVQKNMPAAQTATSENTGGITSNNKDLQNKIAAHIVSQMERYKKYPKQARRISAEGIAKVTFSVNTLGVVSGADITDSSGFKVLDNAALQAAEKIVGSKVIESDAYNDLLQITVPVDFYLN